MQKIILLYPVAALMLVGCGINNPIHPTIDLIPPPSISSTPVPSETPAPTPIPTNTLAPTAPATNTPGPTATPFGQFTGEYVIVQKFKEMDLFLFSNDGDEIANLTKDLKGHKLFMGWSPDGKAILVGEYEADKNLSFTKMKIWLVDIKGTTRKELVESNGMTDYDWSPDGKRIQVECYNGKICLIDTDTFEVIQTRFSGNAVGFSPDSTLLSWDNFPPPRKRGEVPLKQIVQYGTLYTWKEGEANLTQVLSYRSYQGTAGTNWSKDGKSLYILDIVDGKSALAQVVLGSRTVRHLYQFEREICATGLSPDGKIFLVRERVVEGNSATCTGALELVELANGKLTRYEELMDIQWFRWTKDGKALVVLLVDGREVTIDLASGAITPTDWMNWTRFFELWAEQKN
jgi:dipeptidyl aminopeptidase/acylaminoacyl peptidase